MVKPVSLERGIIVFLSIFLVLSYVRNVGKRLPGNAYAPCTADTESTQPQTLVNTRSNMFGDKTTANRALHLLEGKWVYILGDSSLRMFNGALISLLNGTLDDPRFGSYMIHDKGSCEGEASPKGGGCLREYIDMQNRIRLTFTFKTFVGQKAISMENLISPSQQPDVVVLATGAWDKYHKIQTGPQAGNATICLLKEMMRQYPRTDFVVATLISCHRRFRPFALAYNNELRRQLPSLSKRGRRVYLLDREPSTIKVRNATLCEGWHAYSSIVLGHVDEFLDMVDFNDGHNINLTGRPK